MLVHVSLGGDGEQLVHEGTDDEGKLLVEIPSLVMIGLDMFNESRPNFDWDDEAERCAQLLEWRLSDIGLCARDGSVFMKRMNMLCQPGGPTGGAFYMDVVTTS